MIDLLYLGLIILITTSFGKKILGLSKFKFNTFLEEFLFSVSLGLGILAHLVLGMGLLGWFYKWTFYLLLVLISFISLKELKIILSEITKNLMRLIYKTKVSPESNSLTIFLMSILSICIIFNCMGALAPPSASDPLTYHLAIPKTYLQHQRIIYIPYLWYANFPFNLEMLYLLGMLLSSDSLPALIHFFFGILVLLAIISFCRQKFKERFSILAGVIFYSTAMVTFESTSAFVDLGLALFGLLAVYTFLNWQETRQRKWLILSGIFAGFAAGTKYLGLIPILLILIISGSRQLFFDKTKFKYAMSNLSIFGLTSTLVALPWYLKSWIFTGNPIFPFGFRFFGGKDWNIFSSAMLGESLTHYGMGYNLKNLFLSPWNIAIHGRTFDTGDWLGPLFVSFLPFLIFFWRDNRMIKAIFTYSILYYPFWFFSSQQAKFILPLMPFLSIITAYIIFRLFEFGKAIKYATFLVILISFLFNCGINTIFNAQFFPVVFGLESKNDFLSKKTKFYNELMYINHHLPKTSKILIWARDRYYLDRDYIPAHLGEQGLIEYSKYRTVEEFLLRLKELGITHILKPKQTTIEDIQNAPEDERKLYRLQYEMEERYLKPIYKKKAHYVEHRTLLREPKEADVFIYEIKYP